MKKNMKVRVLAGSMAVFMAAAAAGFYRESMPAAEVRAGEQTEELKKAAEDILGDETTEETEGIFKDEAVYVKADASGRVMETTVTEWLKNPGQGEVTDSSELENIKNIKGEETFTEGNDGKVAWKAEGEDIYYQGTTKKEAPIGVKVSYKLNGKNISAQELKGSDGKVEIRIDYENKSRETALVDGVETEMYTPFTVVTALMLPTDEYKNVSVDHGKIISDADKAIVAGLAFPGLQENLSLEDSDISIPDSVTITADVKNASIGPTVTLASAQILSEFGLDEVDGFDDLEDSLEALEDAANQLTDGSREAAGGADALALGAGELADGVHTLNDKGGELVSGVNSLADGINAYAGGVSSLAQGSSQLAAGAKTVDEGAVALQDGITKAKDGAAQVSQGLEQTGPAVENMVNQICAGLDGIKGVMSASGISLTSEQAEPLIVPTKNTDDIVSAAMAQVPAELTEEQKASVRAAIASAVQDTQANQRVSADQTGNSDAAAQSIQNAEAAIDNLKDSIVSQSGAMAAQLGQLKGGADAVNEGLGGLSAGAGNLVQGTAQLRGGADALASGAAELNSTSGLLTAGTSKLRDGGSQLSSGTGQLSAGADAVAEGSRTLAEGNLALADGMEEFKTSGIDKLTEAFNGDIEKAVSRIRAMSELGKNYKSFAGIQEGMEGSTKLVIETEGIE